MRYAQSVRTSEQPEADDMSSLQAAKEITEKMRWHESEIMRINSERRELIRKAWREEGVAQAKIAVALGITNQTIWNEIHKKDNE